jgi:predicted ester cyclase
MSSDDNAQAARRLLDAAFSCGDFTVIDEIAAPDCIEHQEGAEATGPEAVRRTAVRLRTSFPDLELRVDDIAAHRDMVWVRVRARGTDTGGVAGEPPSGRNIEADVVDVMRFRDGKMVEHWGVADRLGMLRLFRVVPQHRQEREQRAA